jgi:hypothetical protein
MDSALSLPSMVLVQGLSIERLILGVSVVVDESYHSKILLLMTILILR